MKKVSFLNTNMEWGGSEKWLLKAASFLKRNDYHVEFICAPHSRLAHDAKTKGYEVRELTVSKLSFLRTGKQKELENILQASYALIMDQPQDFKIGTLAAQRAGLKRIIYRKGLPHPIKDKGINKKLFNQLTHIIANSEETSKSLTLHTERWFPKEKIVTIYNCLEIDKLQHSSEKYYSPKPGEIVLGSAGRLIEQKAHLELLHVAKLLKDQNFDFHLLIAGYGPMESELKKKAASLGLAQKVTLLGNVQDMPKFYNSIDYFVLTSHLEGCPSALIEAMAYKKICFAYDVSSMPEVLNYSNGYLSPFKDVNDLAYKIANHVPSNLAQNAYETVKTKFDYQKNMQKLLDILD